MALRSGVRLESRDGVESLGTREAKVIDGHSEDVVGWRKERCVTRPLLYTSGMPQESFPFPP